MCFDVCVCVCLDVCVCGCDIACGPLKMKSSLFRVDNEISIFKDFIFIMSRGFKEQTVSLRHT